jgi:hypothetical protein
MKPWNLSPETTTGSSEMEAQDMTLYFELIRSLLEMPAGSNSQGTAVVRDDKAFALHVICTFSSSLPDNAIQAFSQRLQNDVDVCREALMHLWQCLQYMPFSIRGDPTLCQAAFESDPRALVWCHILEWKCDTERVQACYEKIQVDPSGSRRATARYHHLDGFHSPQFPPLSIIARQEANLAGQWWQSRNRQQPW